MWASVLGQAASKNLDGGRELSLGGPEGVRAFSPGAAFVDEGYLAKLEFRHAFQLNDSWRARASVFADHAHGRINKNPLPGAGNNAVTLSGAGVGLAVGKRDSFVFDAMAAWPHRGDDTEPRRHPRAWFSLTAYF